MGISLNGFKVVHSEKVYNAVALMRIRMRDDIPANNSNIIEKPTELEVLVINEDGNIISIRDEAWTFQFLPVVTKQASGSRANGSE